MATTERLVGVLRQMIHMVHARTYNPRSLLPNQESSIILRQRRYAKWLCDNDIDAFRVYTHADLVGTRVSPLSGLCPPLTWGYRSRDRDTLYHGSRALVFYMPSLVTYISIREDVAGRHCLTLELAPLGLHDILALDFIAGFARPMLNAFPRVVMIDTTVPSQDDRNITDLAFGTSSAQIAWTDVFVGDYLLAELSVRRVHDAADGWALEFNLLHVTCLATTA